MSRYHVRHRAAAGDPELERTIRAMLGEQMEPLPRRIKDEVVVQATVVAQRGRWPWQRRQAERPIEHTLAAIPIAATAAAVALAIMTVVLFSGPPRQESHAAPGGWLPAASAGSVAASGPVAAPREYVVAGSGSGDARTIGEALTRARAGDTIRVLPGDYVESLVIEKDVVILGDGRRADIVLMPDREVETDGGGPAYRAGIVLMATQATLRNLTIRPAYTEEGTPVLHVAGGAPALSDLTVELPDGDVDALVVSGDSRGSISDSTFEGRVVIEAGAAPALRRNHLREGLTITGAGSDPLIERNTLRGRAAVLEVLDEADPTITGNDIATSATFLDHSVGLRIERAGADIRENDIHDSDVGIAVIDGWSGISNNGIRGHATGMSIACGSTFAAYNHIEGNELGLEIIEACPGRDQESAAGGLIVHGNTICDNDLDLRASGSTDLGSLNFICSAPSAGDTRAARPLEQEPSGRRRVQWLDQPLPVVAEER